MSLSLRVCWKSHRDISRIAKCFEFLDLRNIKLIKAICCTPWVDILLDLVPTLFAGFLRLVAQDSHRKIAVTTVAVSGFTTISLQKSQGFSLCRPQQKIAIASDFCSYSQKRSNPTRTTAASRRSRAASHPQRRRDTKFLRERKLLKLGARKSTQTFSVQSFSTTLRVMDVRTENRGRPHQKLRFPAAPVVGRNFLTPGHPGVRVRNVCGKFGPKSLCLCFRFGQLSPIFLEAPRRPMQLKAGL